MQAVGFDPEGPSRQNTEPAIRQGVDHLCIEVVHGPQRNQRNESPGMDLQGISRSELSGMGSQGSLVLFSSGTEL